MDQDAWRLEDLRLCTSHRLGRRTSNSTYSSRLTDNPQGLRMTDQPLMGFELRNTLGLSAPGYAQRPRISTFDSHNVNFICKKWSSNGYLCWIRVWSVGFGQLAVGEWGGSNCSGLVLNTKIGQVALIIWCCANA